MVNRTIGLVLTNDSWRKLRLVRKAYIAGAMTRLQYHREIIMILESSPLHPEFLAQHHPDLW